MCADIAFVELKPTSNLRGFWESSVEYGVNDWLRRESTTTKVTTIEAFEGVVTTFDVLKLDVDLAF